MPAEFGPSQTVYYRFRKSCRSRLRDKILLHLQARKMNSDEIDWELFCIDGSVIRSHQSAAGAAKKIRRPASRKTTPCAAASAVSAPSCT